MDNKLKVDLAKSQVVTLSRLVLDRDPDFIPIAVEELDKMSYLDLEKVRRAYHELAYAPPL